MMAGQAGTAGAIATAPQFDHLAVRGVDGVVGARRCERGGVSRRDTIEHTSGRVDALARFLLDPFAESAWGLSIGGGMSALFASRARTHSYLVVVTDLEAPRIGVLIPALQLGLGGGVRVGVVIRGYQPGRR